MKKRLKCNLYQFLFRLLPLHAWQVFLMDKHLSVCRRCREEIAADDQVKELFVSPQQAKTLPGIWPDVHKHMDDEDTGDSHSKVPAPKRKWDLAIFPGWQWKAAAVGLLLLLVIVFFPFSFEKESTSGTPQTGIEAEDVDQVVVKSVKIGSEAAKFYFFESKDPDKLIVWTERK